MSKSIKQFFLGGLSLSLVNISGKIVNLLVLPIITAYLSPDDFGVIAVYMLIISILGMVYNPGIISVTLRLYYDNEDDSEENRKLVGSSVAFLIFLPLLILLLSCIFQDRLFQLFFKNFNFWPFGFLAILASITPQVVRLWSTLWVAKHKTNRVAIVSFVRISLAITISLFLIISFEMKAMGRILGLFIGNIVVFFVAFYDIFRYTKFKISLNVLKHTLVLGFPLIFSVFSYVIMESSDKYMLENMGGLHDLGIYDISYTYSAIPLFLIVGFSQVWQPVFFENMKNNSKKILRKLSNYYVVIFFLISISVIAFSNEVFNIFVDESYILAITIVPWIVFGIFFLGLSNLIASIYSYQKRFKEIGVIASIVALLNIILNYFLIKKYGMSGAAIASAFTYLLYFLILIFRIRKDFTSIFSSKIFVLVFIVMTIVFMSFLEINENYLEFNTLSLTIKIIGLIVLVVFLLFSGLIEAKDKKEIYKFFRK
ncbi:MAG: oligosaccharide flippase family protein [Flavobacteriaceae bacterium]